MKKAKKLILVCLTAVMALATFMFAGCGGEKNISVIARTSGSGTRTAFEELVANGDGTTLKKFLEDDGKYANGIIELESTSQVIAQVAGAATGIGYISLGSLDDSVKALTVNGVAASADNVLNGTYEMKRPFVIMTKKRQELTAATQDFIKYLKSAQAQLLVKKDYVEQASSLQYTAPEQSLGTATVVIKGSTSVEELMKKLIDDYKTKAGRNASDVTISMNCEGSSAGRNAVKADTVGNVIGLSSAELGTADAAVIDNFNIALDAIAIIVNKENTIGDVTLGQLFDIYTGAVKKFSEIK